MVSAWLGAHSTLAGAYNFILLGIYVAAGKACPHEQEGNNLGRRVDEPLAKQGHQHRADGVQGGKDNGHDDTVGEDEGVDVGSLLLGDGTVVTRVRVAATTAAAGFLEGVGIGGDACLGEVEAEDGLVVVDIDGRTRVGRVQGVARLPGGDPAVLACQVEATTVTAPDVGHHPAVRYAGTLDEVDARLLRVLGHTVPLAVPGAEGDAAVAILIHEEDLGSPHARADTQADP